MRKSLFRLPTWVMLSGIGCLLLAEAVTQASSAFPIPSDQQVKRLEQACRDALDLSVDELTAMVPVESGGVRWVLCPHCDRSTREGDFSWRPQDPARIACNHCEQVFPGHVDYPDDHYVQVDAPHGQPYRFYYYQDSQDRRYFLRARADYMARLWLERNARDLGDLYQVTGNDAYAHRAAAILYRFAQVYTGYAYVADGGSRGTHFNPWTDNRIAGQPAFRTTRWAWWAYYDFSRSLLHAYERVRNWPAWDKHFPADARERIERDLFEQMAEFVLGFDEPFTNMSFALWARMIEAGRVLGRPDWVHECVSRFDRLLDLRFLYDGHWFETSPAYHSMALNGIGSVITALEGYTDPPGWVHPVTGRRFDAMDLGDQVPQYRLAVQARDRLRLPDGRLIPINDTWAVHGRTGTGNPPAQMSSFLMPGLGLAVLAGGPGGKNESGVYAHLNFTSGRHHKQNDTLDMLFYAHGRELYRDIGYTHTRYRRAWASTTMAHNTVVVNGTEGGRDVHHKDNRVVEFTSGRGLALTTAESDAAYRDVTQRYRRTLILVGHDSHDSYLFDLFEVNGGWQHDYLLHGSADEDSTLSLPHHSLHPYPGTLMNSGSEFVEPETEHDRVSLQAAFGFIRDLHRASNDGVAVVDFRMSGEPDVGVRSLLWGGADMVLYAGNAPSIRRGREQNHLADQYHAPVLVARRQADGNDLSSRFVAVHVPVTDDQAVVTDLEVRDLDAAVFATAHRGEAGRDYFVVKTADDRGFLTIPTADGSLRTDARYAYVRVDPQGSVEHLHIVGGTRLSLGSRSITGPIGWQGQVVGLSQKQTDHARRYFDVNQLIKGEHTGALMIELPDGTVRAFHITDIQPLSSGRTRISVQEDPGFVLDHGDIALSYFPQRRITGQEIRFRLSGKAEHRF